MLGGGGPPSAQALYNKKKPCTTLRLAMVAMHMCDSSAYFMLRV